MNVQHPVLELSQTLVFHNQKIMDNCPDSNYEPIVATIIQIQIVKVIIGEILTAVQIMYQYIYIVVLNLFLHIL